MSTQDKEAILDKYYQSGMHWKSVNRANVLEAMEIYATSRTQEVEMLKKELWQISIGPEPGDEVAWSLYVIEKAKKAIGAEFAAANLEKK